jgi:hypothetical protein
MSEPEQDEKPMESKLFCFIDNIRVCGPDCMSYLPQVPDGRFYVGESWAHCKLLVTADQVGRHIIVITDLLSKARAAQAVQERTKPPPGV